MGKTSKNRQTSRPERRITVRGVRREQPDLRKLARALIEIARAQAEVDAQAQIAGADPALPTPPTSRARLSEGRE